MLAKTYNEQLANQQTTFEWKYDTAGTVKEHKDIPNNTKQLYDYDSLGRLVRSSMLDASSNEMLQQSEYGFDLNNNVTKRIYSIKGQTQVNEYTYGKDNLLMSTKLPNGVMLSNTIDRLNRVEKTTLELPTPKVTSYAYSAPKVSVNGSTTTTQLHRETIDGEVYEYRYDNAGNITEIWKDDVLQSRYGYDDLYQLVTEYDAAEGTETRYTYDLGGNILNRYVVDAQTGKPMEDVDYGYDAQWKDKLVSYGGQPITYDPIGNPLNYLGYTMTWQRGRQLATLTGNGVTSSYQYNADGMRTTKTANGVTSKYYYAGTQLLAEERGNDLLQFYYSGGGIPVAFNLNGVVYYYQINSRGDITGIYDANGTLVVQYTYDAWGNPTGITGSMTDTVGQMNPLRYRGYYYDAETGFYYLQSRYYDPEVGRFLNMDNIGGELGKLGSHNVFAYCQNNPVMFADPTGHAMELFGSTYYISDKNLYDRYYSDASKWPKGANGKPKYSYVYDPGLQEYYRQVRWQKTKKNVEHLQGRVEEAKQKDPEVIDKAVSTIKTIVGGSVAIVVTISAAIVAPSPATIIVAVLTTYYTGKEVKWAAEDAYDGIIYLYDGFPADYDEDAYSISNFNFIE